SPPSSPRASESPFRAHRTTRSSSSRWPMASTRETPPRVAPPRARARLERMSTPSAKREITPDDLWPLERYAAERKALKKALVEKKKHRRIEVGPVATFYFESYDTMWSQIQEMLWIEKGGEAQIADELSAYNPLIPKGSELVATVMFEIDEKPRREAFLARLGGIEETAFLEFAGEKVTAVPEADVDRTTADGKASSVQFLHFP